MEVSAMLRLLRICSLLLRFISNLNLSLKEANKLLLFFTSSKNSGAKLLQEMQRNIDKLKEDRDLIIKKIQMIDED